MSIEYNSTTDRYILYGNKNLPSSGTIAMWYYPNWAVTDSAVHSFFEWQASSSDWLILLKFSDNVWYFGHNNGGSTVRIVQSGSDSNHTQSDWNSIIYTWNDTANQQFFYINGTQIGTQTGSFTVSTAVTASFACGIGNYVSVQSYNFDGRIAEFAMWDRVLSSDERAYYDAGNSPTLVGSEDISDAVCYAKMTTGIEHIERVYPFSIANTADATHPTISYPSAGGSGGGRLVNGGLVA